MICWKSAIVFHLIGALPPPVSLRVCGGRERVNRAQMICTQETPLPKIQDLPMPDILPQSGIFAEIKQNQHLEMSE